MDYSWIMESRLNVLTVELFKMWEIDMSGSKYLKPNE